MLTTLEPATVIAPCAKWKRLLIGEYEAVAREVEVVNEAPSRVNLPVAIPAFGAEISHD